MGTSNLFAMVDDDLYAAFAAVAQLANLPKRAVVEAMIADRAQQPHPAIPSVRAAWTRYRKGDRP